jgi:hypothetical protein
MPIYIPEAGHPVKADHLSPATNPTSALELDAVVKRVTSDWKNTPEIMILKDGLNDKYDESLNSST